MTLASIEQTTPRVRPDAESVMRRTFAEFLALEMAFETVSNIEDGVLVKNAEQARAAVAAGMGGHCLEHAILLRAMLSDAGIPARLVHADQHDFAGKISLELTQSYVLAEAGQSYVLDPFLTARVYERPRLGGYVKDGVVVSAIPHDGNLRMSWYDGSGSLEREELVYLTAPEDARERLMASRYHELHPFGVLAPFYRTVRPHKHALFYFPAGEKLVVKEPAGVRYLAFDALAGETWIPAEFRARIEAALPRVRSKRSEHLTFLERGLFNPFQRAIH